MCTAPNEGMTISNCYQTLKTGIILIFYALSGVDILTSMFFSYFI